MEPTLRWDGRRLLNTSRAGLGRVGEEKELKLFTFFTSLLKAETVLTH